MSVPRIGQTCVRLSNESAIAYRSQCQASISDWQSFLYAVAQVRVVLRDVTLRGLAQNAKKCREDDNYDKEPALFRNQTAPPQRTFKICGWTIVAATALQSWR